MGAISITASQVLFVSGTPQTGIAGTTIAQGDAVYVDTTDSNKIKLADANGTTPSNSLAGIALNAASSGQFVQYISQGVVTLGAGASLLAGDTIWLYSTAGKLTKTATDIVSGFTTIVAGVMLTTTNLQLNITTGGAVA